jgi:quercetin dioxygenase-like cupin family protein
VERPTTLAAPSLASIRRTLMLRRITLVIVVLAVLLAFAVGTALGTPASMAPTLTAETARGPLVDRPLHVNMQFEDPRSRVKLQTKGPIEVAVQRIVAKPGATFGWHSHPGPTIVTVLSGTLSFYHAEDCTTEIEYTANQSFSNLPDEIHLARNEGSVDLVIYASYFVPLRTPVVGLRIDQPSPGAECPL